MIDVFLLGIYFGGLLGTLARQIQDYETMLPGEKEHFREVGSPVASALIQSVFWPLFTLLIGLQLLGSRYYA